MFGQPGWFSLPFDILAITMLAVILVEFLHEMSNRLENGT